MTNSIFITTLIITNFSKASLFLLFYIILTKINITFPLSDTNYTYILNYLVLIILISKLYMGYLNYKQLFECIFNIYNITKKIFISYCTIINYNYFDEDIYVNEDIYANENELHDYTNSDDINLAKIKKINILYIKEILILYVSYNIYICTKLFTNSLFFREYQKLNSFISNEIQRVQYDFICENNKLQSNYIELLILKNLINLKKNKYIKKNEYTILYNSFSKLQKLIYQLQHLSFTNNKIYNNISYITNYIIILNLFNYISYYLTNGNNIYLNGFIIFKITFLLCIINDITSFFINIIDNLKYIFDCEHYIYELNDELFLLNYLYINNIEYRI